GMAALTTLYAATGRMGALGVVVFPVAALCLLGDALSAGTVARELDWRLELHAWLALLAYATLAIAALLATMLWIQERALRRRDFHGWLGLLPPLTGLESLLFRTLWTGFVLLAATLLTGVLFVHDFFAQHLIHKSVLSLLSWLVFGALLVGRWRYGWRGAKAVRLTLVAMGLLVLAFFGSKFVLELLLRGGGGRRGHLQRTGATAGRSMPASSLIHAWRFSASSSARNRRPSSWPYPRRLIPSSTTPPGTAS